MSFVEPSAVSVQDQESGEASKQGMVFLEYYTDPLCSWSWAFEAPWRYLRFALADQIQWRYRMGGLIADWQSFADPFNDICRPQQMGPQWLQVSQISGMPLDARLWQEDPPDSSYPACLAVKAAEQQGQEVAECYLRRLREAAMLERRNIARETVLFTLASEVAARISYFDVDRFLSDYQAPASREALSQDIRDAAYAGIGRFPTLILHRPGARSLMTVGYRPYQALLTALKHLAPDLSLSHQVLPVEDLIVAYLRHWGRMTHCELAEALTNYPAETVEPLLESLRSKGILSRTSDPSLVAPLYELP